MRFHAKFSCPTFFCHLSPCNFSVLLTIRMLAWREEMRLQSKRRLRDRQKQNTNRILNHGGHGDHGGNRGKHTVSMKSRMLFYCPAIEPLVLRVLGELRGKIKIIFGCGRSPRWVLCGDKCLTARWSSRFIQILSRPTFQQPSPTVQDCIRVALSS